MLKCSSVGRHTLRSKRNPLNDDLLGVLPDPTEERTNQEILVIDVAAADVLPDVPLPTALPALPVALQEDLSFVTTSGCASVQFSNTPWYPPPFPYIAGQSL